MNKVIYKLYKLGLCVLLLILFTNLWVEYVASDKVFNNTKDIPYNKVGVLLGTSKYLANGQENLFYRYRIAAAVKLYNSGKIKYIVVSGDNGSKYYDEPTTFKNDLIKHGIPASNIFLDYAGFRTLDSVVRAKAIFEQYRFTVISQQFHNERAVAIGKLKGLQVIGFNAKDVKGQSGLKVKIRELLARVKVLVDEITFKQPKFYGDPVKIPN